MGMSRRHKLLAQYRYANARGTLASFDTPFCAHHSPGLTIYGQSVQNGTPVPDAPVAIESVEPSALKRCGQNLLDNDALFESISPKAYVDGVWEFSTKDFHRQTIDGIPAAPFADGEQYTLACSACQGELSRGRFSFVYTDGSYHALYFPVGDTVEHISFTSSHNKTLTRIGGTYGRSGTIWMSPTIMLNRGVTAAPFVPYSGQTIDLSAVGALGGVGDVHDTLEWTGRKWLLVRQTAAQIFTGDELWRASRGGYYTSISSPQPYRPIGLCDSFRFINSISYINPLNMFYYNGNDSSSWNGNITFGYDDGVGGIENWKAYLAARFTAGMPMGIRYALLAPVVTEIDLPAPVYIKGENSIWVEGSGVAPEIDARYMIHN